jgi:hypothetical protein
MAKNSQKMQEDAEMSKELREEEKKKQEMETQAQTVLTLGLNQTTKFIYRLDGPLGEGNI